MHRHFRSHRDFSHGAGGVRAVLERGLESICLVCLNSSHDAHIWGSTDNGAGSHVSRRTSSIYALDGNGMFWSGWHLKSRHGYVNPAPAGWRSTVCTPRILSTYLKYNSMEKKFITQLVRRTENVVRLKMGVVVTRYSATGKVIGRK